MAGALEGIKVLDLGLLVQGPQAAAALADLGADVIKVELPDMGDQARWIPLSEADLRSAYWIACNRGKRSVTLDLRTEAGAEALRRIAAHVDVIISNFKPGQMEAWGIGYEDLSAQNPGLIFAAGSAFGPVGPDAEREGADLAGQASGGLISTTGLDGGELTPIGATVADHMASQHLAVGVLAALMARERTGRGQRVDVSLLGGQIWAQASEYTYYFLSGELPGRANRGHPLLHAVYGIFETSDGWIAMVGVPPAGRHAFYEAIERPELADDPRFTPMLLSAENKKVLFGLLDDAFKARTTAEWVERLSASGQRVAPVRDYAAVAEDPQVWENGYLIEVDDPDGGQMPMVGSPFRLSDTPATPAHTTPELGQHTEEVLLEAGYTWEEISALRERGAW